MFKSPSLQNLLILNPHITNLIMNIIDLIMNVQQTMLKEEDSKMWYDGVKEIILTKEIFPK